ncbi:beta-N-acetylhexosaminidase [Asticcacaulis sp. AC402]|uniref:beta-N-acetylhexosaminidase n=1 Tax=Asticcacaulis sp. AC402 TaxID=1282361 RepID=UPI0003C3BEBF|nr:beta-N-acetylhexosaminidase [Asticcacaulis sp. AC402]ESQ76360.1 beta-hexosaminidase [Asticcacaulis sp. AC402]
MAKSSKLADVRACIVGLSGTALTVEEQRFFSENAPLGFILFRRNIETPAQTKALVTALKGCVRHNPLILIDQEGGRVRRLKPPHWPDYPPAARFAEVCNDPSEQREMVRLGARLMANDLYELGINVDCVPVLDVPQPGAHDIIGDRAYGLTADDVAVMGRAACEGLLAGGVLPVIKHIPGHGRAGADSHTDLPRVETDLEELLKVDFYPFQVNADMPIAMTAHVLYSAIDRRNTATTSKKCIKMIRDVIGFDGLLICDDLSMNALSGDLNHRARASLKAGCDVLLHCNGQMDQMKAVLSETPKLRRSARRRAEACFRRLLSIPEPLDVPDARARFNVVLARGAPLEVKLDPTEVLAGAPAAIEQA